MKFFETLKKVVCSIDMFYSSEMLRYDSDTQYKTITGGIITVIIVVMVTIAFASMIIDTLNRTAITSSLYIQKNNDPTYYDLKADPNSMFMFGVMLQPIDVSFIVDIANGPRYFDISMILYHLKDGAIVNATDVPLVPCTDQHWKTLPNVVQRKNVYQYQKWLCPEIGQLVALQGSYTSRDLYQASIFARACTNSSKMSRPCQPQSTIDQLLRNKTNFYLSLQYINPVINPNQPDYMSYYLQGNDYVIFSVTQGSEAWFFFSDYHISTDNSYLPFQQNTQQTGVLVQYKAINHPYTVSNYTGYANLYLAKSSNSLYYTRSVQKISAVFSYIGGLIGALTALLFLLKAYTATSLQLSIALDLFHQSIKGQGPQKLVQKGRRLSFQKQTKVKEQLTFNIISFITLSIHKLFGSLGCKTSWKKAQTLDKFKGQILHQLDIKTLLKRMISLENCIGYLFQKHQLQGLKYHKKLDLLKAKHLRQQLVPPQVDADCSDNEEDQSFSQDYQPKQAQLNCKQSFSKNPLGSATLPKEITVCRMTGHLTQAVKDQIIQNSANDCISQDQSYSVQKSISNDAVKINSQKIVTSQTLANLQQLRKQAENNEFSQKIWRNVDESIKKYIENKLKEQPSSNHGRRMSSSQCSIDRSKPRKKDEEIQIIDEE